MIESSYFSNKPTYYQMIGKTLKIVNFIDIETKFENYNSYLYFSLSFFHPLYLTIYLSHFLFLSFFLFFFFLSSFSPSLSLSLSLSLFNFYDYLTFFLSLLSFHFLRSSLYQSFFGVS